MSVWFKIGNFLDGWQNVKTGNCGFGHIYWRNP